MTRPAADPKIIATDTWYSDPGESWDSTPTKIDPTTYRSSGLLPGRKLAAQHLNFELNLAQQWCDFFREYDDILGFDGTDTFNLNGGVVFAGDVVAFSTGSVVQFAVDALCRFNTGTTLRMFSGSTFNPRDGVSLKKVDFNAVDTNRSIAVTDAQHFVNPNGVLGADRNWTLADGTQTGEYVKIVNFDTSYRVNVYANGGFFDDLLYGTSTEAFSIEVYWNGSSWVLSDVSWHP